MHDRHTMFDWLKRMFGQHDPEYQPGEEASPCIRPASLRFGPACPHIRPASPRIRPSGPDDQPAGSVGCRPDTAEEDRWGT